MNPNSYHNFFALLKSGLFGNALTADDLQMPIDWKSIVAMAQKQTLIGIIADAAFRLPAELQPPKDFKDLMQKQSLGIIRSHIWLDKTLAYIANSYRKEGLEGVVLKGQGVARCYPNPKLRQCGDIDFYVGKENYARCADLAAKWENQGQSLAAPNKKRSVYQIGEVTIELHRLATEIYNPFRVKKLQKWINSELHQPDRLRKITINDTEILIPSADFDAFYIFYHAWHHFFIWGVGLRQLCDWAMVLKQNANAIDHYKLQIMLHDMGLMEAWQLFGHIVVEKLGLDPKLMPLYDPTAKVDYGWALDSIMQGGNFGYKHYGIVKSPDEIPLFKRKALSLKRFLSIYIPVLKIIPAELAFYSLRVLATSPMRTVKQLFHRF